MTIEQSSSEQDTFAKAWPWIVLCVGALYKLVVIVDLLLASGIKNKELDDGFDNG